MLKYIETAVTFEEIPSEINLCINITGCPVHCKGCHSKHLWDVKGTDLSPKALERLIEQNTGISCVCFMGGDIAPDEVDALAHYVRINHPDLKVAWYSGFETVSVFIHTENFDYIKLGPYKRKRGPLNKTTTNQRLYKIKDGKFEDITRLFWR